MRRTTSIVAAAGPLPPSVAQVSPGEQTTQGLRPHHPAVRTVVMLAPYVSRRQRGPGPPAVARRAWAAAGPAMSVRTQRSGLMIYRRLSRAVTLAAAAAAVGLAAAPATAATSGTFTATGSMHAAHTQGKATLLPDGQVLVTGANSGGGAPALPSPELYDPVAGTWAVTGQMNTPRIDATATLLPDGQVLVAGGAAGFTATSSAELYNPATGTWAATGSMTTPGSTTPRRCCPTARCWRPAAKAPA